VAQNDTHADATINPDVVDIAPSDAGLTSYDEQQLMTYLRLLDTDARGADCGEIARVVLALIQNMARCLT
jgi:hypothetical protein